jgi:hypothetical protein
VLRAVYNRLPVTAQLYQAWPGPPEGEVHGQGDQPQPRSVTGNQRYRPVARELAWPVTVATY